MTQSVEDDPQTLCLSTHMQELISFYQTARKETYMHLFMDKKLFLVTNINIDGDLFIVPHYKTKSVPT